MTKSPLTWIHLSDLHLNENKSGPDHQRILSRLRDDIGEVRKENDLKPDLLFITGDLVYGQGVAGLSIEDQFEEVFAWINGLRNHLGLSEDRVFICPGNHDVNRDEHTELHSHLVGAYNQDVEGSIDKVNQMLHLNKKEWHLFLEKLDAYKNALKNNKYNHLLSHPEHLCFAAQQEINGWTVNVAGLNGAWSCGTDGEQAKLWLGATTQLNLIEESLRNSRESDLSILINHHPTHWYAAPDFRVLDKRVEQWNFFLHGHEHDAWVKPQKDHTRIAAGATYAGSAQSEQLGYNWVTVKPTGGSEVHLRAWDAAGDGWVLKPVSNKAPKGVWCIEFPEAQITREEHSPEPSESDEPTPRVNQTQKIFVGRQKDLKRLSDELHKHSIVEVRGLSGVGKSEFIKTYLRQQTWGDRSSLELEPDMTFDDFVFLCQKSLGIDQAKARFANAFDRFFFKDNKATPNTLHITNAHFLAEKDKEKTLDNRIIDLLIGVGTFLPTVKIILETKSALPEDLFPRAARHTAMRIKGLGKESVAEYFHAIDPSIVLNESDVQYIWGRLGGQKKRVDGAHPLAMQLVGTLVKGSGNSPRNILERHGNIFEKRLYTALLEEIFDTVLKPDELKLLFLLSRYRTDIPHQHRDPIERHITKFDVLLNRFLLDSDLDENFYWVHALIREMAEHRAEKDKHPEDEDHAFIGKLWVKDIGQAETKPNRRAARQGFFHVILGGEYGEIHKIPTKHLNKKSYSEALKQESKSLHDRGRHKDDLEVLRFLHMLDPQNPRNKSLLGRTIEKVKRQGDQEAFDYYTEAFEIAKIPQNLANILRWYKANRQWQEAIDFVGQLEKEGTLSRLMNPTVRGIYEECLQKTGQTDKAFEERKSRIERGSKDPYDYTDQADFLFKVRKDTSAALEVMKLAEKNNAVDDHGISIRGRVLEQLGRGAEAYDLRQARLDEGSRNPVLYNDQADFLLKQRKDPGAALFVLELAETNNVVNDHIISVRGRVLEQLGRGAEAYDLRQARLDKGSRHPALYNDQANYLRKQNRLQEALEVLDLAKERGTENFYIQNTRKAVLRDMARAGGTGPGGVDG